MPKRKRTVPMAPVLRRRLRWGLLGACSGRSVAEGWADSESTGRNKASDCCAEVGSGVELMAIGCIWRAIAMGRVRLKDGQGEWRSVGTDQMHFPIRIILPYHSIDAKY